MHYYKETEEDRLVIILRRLHDAKMEDEAMYYENHYELTQEGIPPTELRKFDEVVQDIQMGNDTIKKDSAINKILSCRFVLQTLVDLAGMGAHYRGCKFLSITWINRHLIGTHGGVSSYSE
jgi:hypothetical protein